MQGDDCVTYAESRLQGGWIYFYIYIYICIFRYIYIYIYIDIAEYWARAQIGDAFESSTGFNIRGASVIGVRKKFAVEKKEKCARGAMTT